MSTQSATQRVALVGAGFVAAAHLEVLSRCRGVEVVALCDPMLERARDLSVRFGVKSVYGSVAQLIEEGGVDAAHVLVPPHLHYEVTKKLLEAGLHTLVEKPLALNVEEVAQLGAIAAERGLALGVNHTMVFHPMVQRLSAELKRGRLGRLEHVSVVHNVPLRQLETGDVSHFMFWSEANILLEQAVHPFSIVQQLLGRCLDITAHVESPRALSTGAPFYDTWSLAMRCERGTAQVFLGFGRAMTETTVHAIATDGSAHVDLHRSTFTSVRKTRWLDFWDAASNSMRAGCGLIRQGFGGALDYGLGLFRLRRFPDPFLQSMGASVAAFHAAVRAGAAPPSSAEAAEQVVEMCERTAASAGVTWERHERFSIPVEPEPPREGEVVVTGATGFLGRSVVPALLADGHPVTALVRRPEFVGPHLRDPRVRLLVGDAKDPAAVRHAMEGASFAVHMATCAADPGERMEDSMAAGARVVGEACIAAGVRRLVFTSSTAALYLGGPEPVSGAVGPDPRPQKRAEYARGKIAAEHELQRLVREGSLPLVILRPAIVVGEGGNTTHSGVGLWVRDNHCVGWGMGAHPLPFVLARDCAQAIAASLVTPGAVGKAYNLAGAVRLSARDYVSWLRRRTGRDYHFHGQPVWSISAIETGKWFIKVLARRPREMPSRRDLLSRGFRAPLDCSDVESDLSWQPEGDLDRFLAEVMPLPDAAEASPSPEPPAAVVDAR